MPVLDGVFVPRTPLTPAELHVDFLAHDNHVLQRRRIVEQLALPKALRIAQVAALVGDIGDAHTDLTQTLARGLMETARYGFLQSQLELGQLRHAYPEALAANPPAPRTLATIVSGGLASISVYVTKQAVRVTDAVIMAVLAALRGHDDETIALMVARRDAQRKLHNGVLDLVGTTLNLGRTAGAARLETPPVFALRSEQLDGNTCEPCDTLHGAIVRFGSTEYFSKMPPLGCLGGGRCRGLYVFADGPSQVRAPELQAA